MRLLRISLISFTTFWLGVGCSTQSLPTSAVYPENPTISDRQGQPRDTTTFYFPPADSLRNSPPVTEPRYVESIEDTQTEEKICHFTLMFASRNLFFFGAPVLSNYYLGQDIYRFLWLRSFDRPVLLTLQQNGDGAVLHTELLTESAFPGSLAPPPPPPVILKNFAALAHQKKRAEKKPEVLPTEVAFQGHLRAFPLRVAAEETRRPLTSEQWQHFQGLLAASHFPQLPTCNPSFANDGAEWLLEAHTAGNYHAVCYHSPPKSDGFRQTCEYLLDLSSARKEERY